MAKYNERYKLKGGLGGTLQMIVDATSGYVAKEIVQSMITSNGFEVKGIPVLVN